MQADLPDAQARERLRGLEHLLPAHAGLAAAGNGGGKDLAQLLLRVEAQQAAFRQLGAEQRKLSRSVQDHAAAAAADRLYRLRSHGGGVEQDIGKTSPLRQLQLLHAARQSPEALLAVDAQDGGAAVDADREPGPVSRVPAEAAQDQPRGLADSLLVIEIKGRGDVPGEGQQLLLRQEQPVAAVDVGIGHGSNLTGAYCS